VRPSVVWAIFVKELREIVRDRRALFGALGLPLLIYPLLLVVAGQATAFRERLLMRQPEIAVWGAIPPALLEPLVRQSGAHVLDVRPTPPAAAEAEARRAIAAGRVQVVLVADADAAAQWAGDGSARVHLYYDALVRGSQEVHDRLLATLAPLQRQQLETRLTRHQLPSTLVTPLATTDDELAGWQRRAGDVAARALAFILLFVVLACGSTAAIDLTAGEKERQTLQTLLCAPVQSLEIVIGKYLVVVVFALAGGVMNLLSMSLALTSRLTDPRLHVQLTITLPTLAGMLVTLVPLVLFVSALVLGLSLLAHSAREAQAYVNPALYLLLALAGIGCLPGLQLTALTSLVPVTNVVLVARALFTGALPAWSYALVLASTLAVAALTLAGAARLFREEQLLLGGASWRPWKGRHDK
jgi:sodium transport system permease protein